MKKIILVSVASFALLTISGCSKNDVKENKTESTVISSSIKDSSTEEVEGNSSEFKAMVKLAQTQVDSLKEQMADMYSDIAIEEGEDHTIVYKYTFLEEQEKLDVEAMRTSLIEAMKPTMDTNKTAFPGLKFQYIYMNPDGKELGNIIITEKDTDAIEATTESTN